MEVSSDGGQNPMRAGAKVSFGLTKIKDLHYNITSGKSHHRKITSYHDLRHTTCAIQRLVSYKLSYNLRHNNVIIRFLALAFRILVLASRVLTLDVVSSRGETEPLYRNRMCSFFILKIIKTSSVIYLFIYLACKTNLTTWFA